MTLNTSIKAFWKAYFSICPSYFPRSSFCHGQSSSSMDPPPGQPAEFRQNTCPPLPRYGTADCPNWLQARIDAADQRFVGKVAVRAEGEFPQQEIAQGIHTVSGLPTPPAHHIAFGFTHLVPPNFSHPWPYTFPGKGRSNAISIAGQIIEWKRTISLPTKWTSAGQYCSKS